MMKFAAAVCLVTGMPPSAIEEEDWPTLRLVLDLHQEMGRNGKSSTDQEFEAWRKQNGF